MIKNASSSLQVHLRGLPALLGLSLMISAATLAADDSSTLPEVSKDGLHLMKGTKAEIVYVKPGASLEGYTAVMLADCYVDFKKDWQKDYNMNEVGLQGRISDKDAEHIKKDLAAEFNKVFAEELTKKGHTVVDQPGDNVLLLRPALVNVVVNAPDPRNEMGRTLVESAGAMTLYMDMFDSSTNDILVRVIDQRGDDESFAQRANRATNRAAADRIIRFWADLLSEQIGKVKDSSGS